jgi:pilus assembly protein Flp/PilA
MDTWRKFLRDQAAATGIEYGVIAGLIALGVVTTVNTVGGRLSDVLTVVASGLASPPPGSNAP